MPRTTRAKYDPTEEAKKVIAQIPPDKLRDKQFVWQKVEAADIEISKMAVGRIRNNLLKSNAGFSESNGHARIEVDLMDSVTTVLKILPSVGGLEGLERAVAVIRRVKERA